MLPKQLTSLIERKERTIERYRNLIDNWTRQMQFSSLDAVLKSAINRLEVVDGVILNTNSNLAILAEIDRGLNEINGRLYPQLMQIINNGTGRIIAQNTQYFTLMLPAIGKRLDVALGKAQSKMAYRIGLREGKLIRNGWLESVINDTTVLRNVKELALKSVLSGAKFSDTKQAISDLLIGTPEQGGAFEKYLKNTVYDVFQQYDAAYNEQIAEDLELKYFIYTGGLVRDSRDFCREHNGRVWTRDEAEQWENWRPVDALFITEFKQKDIYAVPSYLGYVGYQPLIDRGGYNCRHQLAWISDERAFELRPELKEERQTA